jgi:hypothetical protein
MSKGVLIYALNNEQIDYAKLALNAAKQVKQHLGVPVALVTDSADWLTTQYPNYKDDIDMVIKVVQEAEVQPWNPTWHYPVSSLAFYNGTIWRKVNEGPEILDVVEVAEIPKVIDTINYFEIVDDKVDEIHPFNQEDFESIYQGIDIDKWYPNLPYLVGQHVWHNNTLYRCAIQYTEGETFSKDKYISLIDNVMDREKITEISKGDTVLYNRNLWMSIIDIKKEETSYTNINEDNFTRIYEGIDIDKWYPNLPYLVGQHVWYDNILYRCHTEYTESNSFSKDQYDIVLENVKDGKVVDEIAKGDIVLYDRVLWMSDINANAIKEDITKINIQKTYKIEDNFTRVYEGIDIDKWYPNLPYLVGQHVWYDNTLYRCHTEYTENDAFSKDQYNIVLENVNELTQTIDFAKGDILFHERVLWMSLINYKFEENKTDKIRYDLWEDTKERFLVYDCAPQYRQYFDGAMTHKKLKFKNDIRVKSFELSPFDETLVIDCDYLINNDILKYCWQQPHDFLIHKQAFDLSGYRYDPRLITLSDKSIDFYWATVFFFRKNKNTEIFFNYLGHVQENWNYYRYVYQIEQSLYRNDFAFSIAIHVMNGYQNGTWAHDLPGKLYYTIDKDILLEHDNTEMKFLIEKEKYRGEYTVMKTNGISVHVMNKFSISRILNEELNV